MALNQRKRMYGIERVNRQDEIDHLDTNLNQMNLRTIARERVSNMTRNRLDLISFKHYNSFDYGWLIAEHNDIIDPIDEVVVGKVLRIPSIEDYYRFSSRNSKS